MTVPATLKNQVLGETRTSAFAIEPDNTPLYRRFSSLELEGNEGDKADTLRLSRNTVKNTCRLRIIRTS